jgi:molybdate transport system ATP-binding protein
VISARFSLNLEGFHLETRLDLDSGVLVLFGPSGSGKTLTLHAIAGLVRPATGLIKVAGETVFEAGRVDIPVHLRRIGWVPQHQALFPFLSVAENVAFGLPRHRRRPDEPDVVALMEELGLTSLARARPSSLSGGERQRAALARALVVRPRLLLLDEPFAALDWDARQSLRTTLRATLARHTTPAIFVTHDPEEAVVMGDRLVRYERGGSVESGDPATLLANRLKR